MVVNFLLGGGVRVAVSGRRCARCGGALSSYNTESLCSPCARGGQAALLVVPARVWESPQVREALADWDVGRLMRLLREMLQLSQSEIATRTGLSPSMLSYVEAGARRVSRIDQIMDVYDALDVPHHLLPTPRRTQLPRYPPPPGEKPSNDPAAAVVTAPEREHKGAWDDPAVIFAQTRTLTDGASTATLPSVLAASVRAIVERYEAHGPHALAPETRELRSLAHTLLGDRKLRFADRRELLHIAGQTSALLAYMAVNAAAPLLTAQAYAAEAMALADEIGDTQLAVWTAGTQSLAYYYAGSYREADRAAAAGIDRSPTNPQAIRLFVNGRARALGRLNDRQGAEEAIGQALDLSEHHDLPAGLTSCIALDEPYSDARTLANAVTTRLSLQDISAVHSLAEEIEGLVDASDSAWSRALVRLDQATAYLGDDSPQVERAMELGQSALEAGSGAPIRSVLQRAVELHHAAAAWHAHPSVREYASALQMWRTSPAVERLANH